MGWTPEAPPSVKEWVLTLIILMIPLVNLVMMFVWGFGSGPKWRANFCKANLLIMAVCLILYLAFIVVFGGMMIANQAS
ncbi:MAG: hypothetical protein KBC57_12375 [Neisseriaceae bacterium]|nr:hypothetical protein [Neisseriaceae bacterium]MBP6863134.1 hypothetical protein [Neisseriaceae bacterium]